jgi:hypothetical protein
VDPRQRATSKELLSDGFLLNLQEENYQEWIEEFIKSIPESEEVQEVKGNIIVV